MAVNVMMFGGHRDGEILVVPGEMGQPDSRRLRVTLKPPPPTLDETGVTAYMDKRYLDLEIVPRHASSGPAWKIDLPKELW